MPVRLSRLLPALGLAAVAACHSDKATGPFDTPLPASLQVGDLVRLNVNGEDPCTNGMYHIARVEAIGDRAMILADTLNPAGGFTTADYQRYAAKFDTLIYPLDEGAFGAPTDIDNNGRVGIVFTRAVNELTKRGATTFVEGFTFSRDLFPIVANSRAEACPTSNQGEFFYALAPDPTGIVNGNKFSTGFVDTATVPVLAHELQHLINASRKLYVNTSAPDFEEQWLDEGLAHIAEELLFYRESGTQPRSNLDTPLLRSRNIYAQSFDDDMSGNAGRYQAYLESPSKHSPYAADDSLSTRGAAWSWLRYLADQKMTSVTRSSSAAIELSGTGSVGVPGDVAGAEYYATLVNTATTPDNSAAYTISATNVIPPTGALVPIGGATLSRSASLTPLASGAAGVPAPRRDLQFESRLRAQERAIGPARFARARAWYRNELGHAGVPQGGRFSLSAAPIASPDADIWNRLVNNTVVGIANVQQVFGITPSVAVADWSASHAVDDVSSLVSEQFLQKSWNWHSIYSVLCSAKVNCPYPLPVRVMTVATPLSGSIVSGGSAFFRLAVPAGATSTVTVTSATPTTAPALKLLVIRTK